MKTWTLRAFGEPAPKGSWDHIPRGGARPLRANGETYWRIRDMVLKPSSGDRLARWKHAVELAVLEAGRPRVPFADCPVLVGVTFYLRRPQRPKHELPIVEPDLDKLIRALGDFLQGVYWKNDSQIVRWSPAPEKVYGDEPGAAITIQILDEESKQLDLGTSQE